MKTRVYELPLNLYAFNHTAEKYYITKDGIVLFKDSSGACEEIKPVKIGKKLYVDINHCRYYLPKIMLIAWIGDLDLPIECLDEQYPTSRNIKYIIDGHLIKIDNIYYIANIPFKNIEGYRRYFISPFGTIYDELKNRFISHTLNEDSYHIVKIYNDKGKTKSVSIHRAVYKTYFGKISDNLEIDHLIAKSKNGICDIEAIPHEENILRARNNGCYGTTTEAEVHEICKLLQDGYRAYEIANLKGLYKPDTEYYKYLSYIYHIHNGECWKDISSQYNFIK